MDQYTNERQRMLVKDNATFDLVRGIETKQCRLVVSSYGA